MYTTSFHGRVLIIIIIENLVSIRNYNIDYIISLHLVSKMLWKFIHSHTNINEIFSLSLGILS